MLSLRIAVGRPGVALRYWIGTPDACGYTRRGPARRIARELLRHHASVVSAPRVGAPPMERPGRRKSRERDQVCAHRRDQIPARYDGRTESDPRRAWTRNGWRRGTYVSSRFCPAWR